MDTTRKALTSAEGTTFLKAASSAKSTTVVKPNSKIAPNSTVTPALPVAQSQANDESASAEKGTTVPGNVVRDKHKALESRGLGAGHAHAEKERRRSKNVFLKSDPVCDEKDLMHAVADVTADDGRIEDPCLSDARADKIYGGVRHVSSAARAAKSVKKQYTFIVRRVLWQGSRKKSAVIRIPTQIRKATAKSNEANSSGKKTGKRKSMCSGKKTE